MRNVVGAAFAAVLLLLGTTAFAADKTYPLDVTVGKADAPVTVIEYFSLDCPHCAAFHAQTMPQVKSDLIDPGKMKLVMRDFPLSNVALAAALVAHCAGPDRYPAFVATFLSTQQQWGTAADPVTALKAIARLGGVSDAQSTACLANNDWLQQIKDRQTDAENDLKVDSTPSFIVAGKLYAGEMTYDAFAKLIAGAS